MNKLTLNLLILLTIPCILYGRNFNVMDFGARGNGISDDAIAIQKAVDACTNAGGGDVVFSANHTFLSGPVQLKSNVNIVFWKPIPSGKPIPMKVSTISAPSVRTRVRV